MTDKAFYTIFKDALSDQFNKRKNVRLSLQKFTDKWLRYEDENMPVWSKDMSDTERQTELKEIWDLAHIEVKTIRQFLGMTQIQFSRWSLVPLRSIANWEQHVNEPPDYVKAMLAWRSGLFAEPSQK